ncbi:TPA: hypothetical protein ACYESM_004802 [Klebsiella pneumoniae]
MAKYWLQLQKVLTILMRNGQVWGVALARELPAADLIQISGQRMAGRVTLVTLEYSRMFGQPPARIIRDALESEQSVKYVAPTGGLA